MDCQGELLMFTEDGVGATSTTPSSETLATTYAEIDGMDYEAMRRLVCTAPLYHPLFRGEVGRHFHASLKQKRHALSADERVAIHNRIGF